MCGSKVPTQSPLQSMLMVWRSTLPLPSEKPSGWKKPVNSLSPKSQVMSLSCLMTLCCRPSGETVRSWFWKRKGHINVLEMSSAVSNLASVGRSASSVRFCCCVGSAVCKGAFSKGRSASRALQPLLKRACALCVCSDLYPGWIYTHPTRLNCADDPTRDCPLRGPLGHSLLESGVSFELLRKLNLLGLKKFAANWVRLVLLVSLWEPATAADSGVSVPVWCHPWTLPFSTFVDFPGALALWFCSVVASLRSYLLVRPWEFLPWTSSHSTTLDLPGASLGWCLCLALGALFLLAWCAGVPVCLAFMDFRLRLGAIII